ncbi:hypothetical protein Glove_13g75 [Diversispora epigaea]|uniref:BTB domain-containing protein n=1 Tax=Diversispora epigaea TaxID=1348612 RepID=A0A397JPB2_9GLOM|nr:hypothetical protein Glove_13g75 [Diversispora epigaea]
MTFKFFDKLSQNFIELINDKDDYNVIIEIENKEKSFTAHSNILKYRSPYFRKELENIQPNENNIKTIIKSSVSAQIVNVILKYIYGGIVNLENVEIRFIFDLMLAANEFELKGLTNKLETHLIDTKASWLKTYFSLSYRTIFKENNFENLENYCNDIIVKHPNIIFNSSDFASIPESALVSLLKRDDLQMEEVKIWDYVIKWGVFQNPTLPTNLEEWSKENFLTLKTTLQQCLRYIRYFLFSSIEIFDKIMPYKKILDKQLWKDINRNLAAPDRPVKSIILPARSALVTELPPRIEEPFSTIISEEHAAEISSWIDHKIINYSTTNIPYKFKLILSGTRDGFAPQTFWNICHGHAKTVVVAKVKGTDEILGGYNPLAWDNTYNGLLGWSKWMKTKDSFIFSLKNCNIQNSILNRVKNSRYAICKVSKCYQNEVGPSFELFHLYSEKSDFTLDSMNYCGGDFREKSSSSNYFSIINYEVGPSFELFHLYSEKSDFTLDSMNYCGGDFREKSSSSNYFSIINYETETNVSFIISLKNSNINNLILSHVKVSCKANNNYSESFGDDLYMTRNRSFRIYNNSSYEKLIRKTTLNR